jgi:hypothetical protein
MQTKFEGMGVGRGGWVIVFFEDRGHGKPENAGFFHGQLKNRELDTLFPLPWIPDKRIRE